ncbi:hypothetical protein D3C76_455180 [compost metagenome]
MPHIQLQNRSVSEMSGIHGNLTADLSDPSVLYSGSHILYGLRDWYENNIEVQVDGRKLIETNAPDAHKQTIESILKEGIKLLEPDSNYRTITQQDRRGQIVRIFFVKS